LEQTLWRIVAAFALVASLCVLPSTGARAQEKAGFAMPLDWGSRRILHSRALDKELVRAARSERRVLYNWFRDSRVASASYEHQHPRRAERKARQRVDWNFPLGAGTVAPIMSPAKFSFNTATTDCTNDYVVYALNVAGSDTQPNMFG